MLHLIGRLGAEEEMAEDEGWLYQPHLYCTMAVLRAWCASAGFPTTSSAEEYVGGVSDSAKRT